VALGGGANPLSRYPRLGMRPQREVDSINKRKRFRLYREENLAVRRQRGRKRATGPGNGAIKRQVGSATR